MMILRTITLIIVCLLLTAFSLKAEEKSFSEILEEEKQKVEDEFEQNLKKYPDEVSYKKLLYSDFNKIKIIEKMTTNVYFMGDDAEKIGLLNVMELTDYLRLRIRNNFENIKIEDSGIDKYKDEQVGMIKIRVWVLGTDYPIAYHLKCEFRNNIRLVWGQEYMGIADKERILNAVKEGIDVLIQVLAMDFFDVRGDYRRVIKWQNLMKRKKVLK